MIAIKNILSAEQLKTIRAELAESQFVDGKLTAGQYADEVKHNLQLKRESAEPRALDQMIVAALTGNEMYRNAVLPRRLVPPIFSKYEPGMAYGDHVDSAMMGTGKTNPIRADVSTTVFLSDPDEYDGGELVIKSGMVNQNVKLEAGCAVVYPSTSLHQVAPVTRGERLVAVTWAQSFVRDAEIRNTLMDLNHAAARVAKNDPQSVEARLLFKCYNNLLRHFVEA